MKYLILIAIILVTLIVVTGPDESIANSSYYQKFDGIYCLKCPPGTFLEEECRVNGSQSTCQPCRYNRFMNEFNIASHCYDCSVCTEEEIEEVKCNLTHDVVCVCPEGKYRHTYQGGTRKCLPITTHENEEILFTGSSTPETVPQSPDSSEEEEDVILEPVDRDISETSIPPDDTHSKTSRPVNDDTSSNGGWTWTWLLAIFIPLSIIFLIFLYHKYKSQFSIQIRRFRMFASDVYRCLMP